MKALILVLIIASSNVHAQTVMLPPAVVSLDDIVNDFRETLITKMGELGKNFITTSRESTLIYTNSADLKCNGFTTSLGQAVSSIKYSYKLSEKDLAEKTTYTGCNQLISIVEDVYTEGSKLTPLTFSEVVKGKRSFDLAANESKKIYRISNSDNEELFKLMVVQIGNRKLVDFYITESKFLSMVYEFTPTSTRLTFYYPGYKGKYVRKFSSWEYSVSYDPFYTSVLALKNKDGSIDTFYFNTAGERLSQADFLSKMEFYLFRGPISRIRSFLDYHNFYFPTTQQVQSSGQNERLKEELRLAFNRLQNNVELNLVKKQIQDYIEAAEKGLISDSRPKE